MTTSSSSSSREPTAESRGRVDAAPPPSAGSPIRAAAWLALALVLAVGVVLYFRHRNDVSPLLGASPAPSAAAEAGPR